MNEINRLKSLKKFRDHRAMAKRRGVEFNLTHEQWWDIWEQSDRWEQRGRKRGQFVMSRKNDSGAYEIQNVFIQAQDENMREAQIGRKHSPDHVEKVRLASTKSWINRKQLKESVNG